MSQCQKEYQCFCLDSTLALIIGNVFSHELSLDGAREPLCSAVSNTGAGLCAAQKGGDLDKGVNESAAFPEGSAALSLIV